MTFVDSQDLRHRTRDRECSIHTSDINVLKTEVKNQGNDIEILFNGQTKIKKSLDEVYTDFDDRHKKIDSKVNGFLMWAIGVIFLGMLAIAASIYITSVDNDETPRTHNAASQR
jgi:hypothetical protein